MIRHGAIARLDDDVARQLRLAEPTLDECDRHFRHTASRAAQPRRAFRQGRRSRPRSGRSSGSDASASRPPASIARGAIAHDKSCDGPDVGVGEAAQQPAAKRPVHNPAARGTYRDPMMTSLSSAAAINAGSCAGSCDRFRVHLADDVDRFAKRFPETVDVGPAQPSMTGPVQDADAAGVLARELIRETGPCRRGTDRSTTRQAEVSAAPSVPAVSTGRFREFRCRSERRRAPSVPSWLVALKPQR